MVLPPTPLSQVFTLTALITIYAETEVNRMSEKVALPQLVVC